MQRRAFLGMTAGLIAVIGSDLAVGQGPNVELANAVKKLADLLETGYVIPEIGKRYAAFLRQKLTSGGYAVITDAAVLGQQLTTDLNALSPDRHLRVSPEPTGGVPRRGPGPGGPGPQPAPQAGPRTGPAPRRSVEDAGWVAKDVAYIRFIGFTGETAAVAATAEFMKTHATAKGLIIDCRYNGGGGVQEMNEILPYLYAKETTLVEMQMAESVAKARGGTPFDQDAFIRPAARAPSGVIAREHYVVPHKTATGLFGAKVFYLTSNRTASAGEHLALALKRTKRAVQIGETTAGANHFGGFEPIGAGLAVFLPVGRTIDPDTGADWEATGLAPDVAVPPALALEEALRRAGAL